MVCSGLFRFVQSDIHSFDRTDENHNDNNKAKNNDTFNYSGAVGSTNQQQAHQNDNNNKTSIILNNDACNTTNARKYL